MSYILEALQEAQKSRDDNAVPDLKSVHLDLPQTRRIANWWVYLSGLVVLVVSALILWSMSGPEQPSIAGDTVAKQHNLESTIVGRSSSVDGLAGRGIKASDAVRAVSNDTIAATEDIDRIATNPEPLPVSPLALPDVSKTKVVGAARAPTNNESREPQLNTPVTEGDEADVRSESLSNKTIGKGNDHPVVNAKPLEVQLPSVANTDVERTLTPANTTESRPVVGEVPFEAEQASELVNGPEVTVPVVHSAPHFRELPFDIQQSLPIIIYSVHLYAVDPQHRMVKIDGRVKREGDTVKPGLVLEEITPTGAIFSFKDNVFRVPVSG